jgi:hypothetical protein
MNWLCSCQQVIQNGAHISNTPGKTTNFLVADAMGSSKTFQAKGNDIPVVTEAWVRQSIKTGKLSTDKSQILSGEVVGSGTAATKGPAKQSKAKAAAAAVSEDEEEEEEEKPKKKGTAKKAAPKTKTTTSSAGVFDGEVICISGAFTVSQEDLRALVAKHGATLAATPTKQCTYLVADQMGSAKTAKAKKDGINIVTEDWVRASIKAGKMVDPSPYLLGFTPLTGGVAAMEVDEKKPATKKKAAGKRKKPSAEEADDDGEEQAEPEAAPAKKKKMTAASTKKAAAAKEAEEEMDVDDGAGAVAPSSSPTPSAASPSPAAPSSPKPSSGAGRKPDREVPGRDTYTIVGDYATLLNQTNITGGRNNSQ